MENSTYHLGGEPMASSAGRTSVETTGVGTISVGTIGFGKIVEDLHAPCLTGMEECELVAVCDPREERLAHAKSAHMAVKAIRMSMPSSATRTWNWSLLPYPIICTVPWASVPLRLART